MDIRTAKAVVSKFDPACVEAALVLVRSLPRDVRTRRAIGDALVEYGMRRAQATGVADALFVLADD